MRLATQVAVALGVLLVALSGGIAAADHHQVLQVDAANEWVQTTPDNEVSASFVVTNTGDRVIQNATVEVVNASDELDVDENASYSVGRLNASENETVHVQAVVPADTADGNYTVDVRVTDRSGESHDNATGLVWVNTASDESTGSDGSSADGGSADSEENESASGGVGIYPEEKSWLEKLLGKLGIPVDIPPWVPFA